MKRTIAFAVLLTSSFAYSWNPDDPNLTRREAEILEDLRGNIVLLLNFDESEGATTFIDSSQQSNDGTCASGPTCPSIQLIGKFNQALKFDGSNDLVTVLDHNKLDFGTGDMSISVWIFPIAPGTKRVIIDKGNESADTGYVLHIDGADIRKIAFTKGGDIANAVASDTGTVHTNKWMHIVVTLDTSGTDTVAFFSNGVARGTATTTTDSATNASDLTICHDNPDSHGDFQKFNAVMDQVILYDTKIGREAIEIMYRQGSWRHQFEVSWCEGLKCSFKKVFPLAYRALSQGTLPTLF